MQGMRTPTLPHRWDERTWKEGFDRGYYEGLEEGQALGWRTLRSQILTRLDHVRSDLRLGLCLAATPSEVWEEMVWVIEDTVREYRAGQQAEQRDPRGKGRCPGGVPGHLGHLWGCP